MAVTFLTSEDEKKFVKTVNGKTPDENGNVSVEASSSSPSGGNVDLTGVVKSVNGQIPDESGNVEITIPNSGEIDALVNKAFKEHYSWDKLAHDDAPRGWVKGFFSTTQNAIASGLNFITTANAITLEDVKTVMVTPPKGYAVEINAFKSDGTCDTFGNANSTKAPENVDVTRVVEMSNYKSIRVSVGHLNGNAAGRLADESFINSIVMVVTYNNIIDNDVPRAYFREEIETTVNSVREMLTEPCLVFPLITDIHYKSTTEAPQIFDTSIVNMRNVIKQLPCDFVLDLGDNVGGYTDKDETIKRVTHMMNQFRTLNLPLYSAIGNHDTNYYHDADDLFTLEQMFGLYISSTKDAVYNTSMNGTDYYKDFDNLNIRLVVLNGSYGDRYKYSSETVNWFINTALKTDKMVVLTVHYSIINTQNYNHTGDATNGKLMADAVSSFIEDGGALIQLCGHSHADYAYTSPWLTVFSSAAMFENVDLTAPGYTKIQDYTGELVAPQQEVGTVTEDCWSVVVVRPQARKINLIRFGAGDDREFSF